ncbi:MAG: hypothetical protein HW380_3320 [Magnetococcales bacterium]|nr:hypothetical protein [Magnetococcales bacterium]HIJ84516.1 acyl--CoA ligase [Magnetococcales bacterium]
MDDWTTPFAGENLLESLQRHAFERGAKPALVWDGAGEVDYATLWSLLESLARGLKGRGLEVGARVVLVMDASRPCLLFYLGLLRLGGVAVVVDPGLTRVQWSQRLLDLAPAMVVAPSAILAEIAPCSGWQPLELSDATVATLVREGEGVALPGFPANSDAVLILATTGTTGVPKYVGLTLGNISAAATQINAVTGLTEADREVITLPLYHSFGLGRLRCGLGVGCRIHLLPGRFRPERLLKVVKASAASVFAQVPAGIRLLLAFGKRVSPWLSGVRLVEIGSASMEIAEKQRLMDYLPQARIWHHYGLTEASRSLFLEYHQAFAMDRLNALGQPPPGVEMMLDSGQSLMDGELLIRGPHVTMGYFIPAGQPSPPVRDGKWFATGDLVRRDELGFYHYVGRVDDVINLGGFKVHPLEVETMLQACPGILDVAVVAQGDGAARQLVALVLPDPSHPFAEKSVRDWMHDRLEPYKHPQSYRMVASLPRTASGKLLRRELSLANV